MLTGVLTLALAGTGRPGNDLDRALMLLRSLNKFMSPESMSRLLVITRAKDFKTVNDAVRDLGLVFPYEVLDERDVSSVLIDEPPTTNNWPNENVGWLRQQILKLAAADIVQTEYYMTLDSDVLFVKSVLADSLLKGGKSLVNVEYPGDYNELYISNIATHEIAVRNSRYASARRLLGYETQGKLTDRSFWYGETPVVLSSTVVRLLRLHIERQYNMPCDAKLAQSKGWTEYPLYFTYAEESKLLNTYHNRGNCCTLLNLHKSLWWEPEKYKEPVSLENWDVSGLCRGESDGFAVVVQSYLGYDPAIIMKSLAVSGINFG